MQLQTMEMAGMEVTAPAMGTAVMAATLEPVLMETVEMAAMAVRMVEMEVMAAMVTAPVTVEMAVTRDLAD